MNYYPFHIGDYASATRHLSWDEDMAYRRLMDAYYTREAPIPKDPRQVYRLVSAATQEQREAVDVVLAEFFEDTPEGWRNSRCDAEIHSAALKREKASQSAHARWRNATAKPTQSDGNANASPETCERIAETCEGNAPNPNPNTSISIEIDSGASAPAAPEPKKQAKRATGMPPDFYPNETGVSYAEGRRLSLYAELEKFRNFHGARGTTFKDWQAAWRTWCDKAVEFGRSGSNQATYLSEKQRRDDATTRAIFGSLLPATDEKVIEHEPATTRLLG